MKSTQLLLMLIAMICIGQVASKKTPAEMCQMAHQNLQREAKKIMDKYGDDQRSAFQSVINMSYIIPKLMEVCEPITSSIEVPDMGDSCSDHMSFILQVSQMITQSDYQFSSIFASHFQQVLLNTIANCDSSKLNENGSLLRGGNGGNMNCIVCDVLVTLATNDAVKKKQNISDYLSNHFCKILPNSFSSTCQTFITQLGPYIIEGVSKKDNSDVICRKANACSGQYSQCNLHSQSFPQPSLTSSNYEFTPTFIEKTINELKAKLLGESEKNLTTSTETSNPWQWIMDLVNRFADDHLPIVDFDQDGFSTIGPLRGYNWRGKDCDDFSKDIYPGRKVFEGSNTSVDFDCNGISGVNTVTGRNYEDELCGQSERLGVIVIGDSAGAHFQVPAKYFNVTMWEKDTFNDILDRAANEFDLPQLSASTGFESSPLVHSFYQRLVEINRCNLNDYQNIGVNGARSSHINDFMAIRRNQTHDHPMLVIWELIGNDVCSGHKTVDSFTTPDEFRKNILRAWDFLDTVLPAGSHIVVWGVADGQILYNILAEKQHPLFIKYKDFYDYLNCLDTSPCWGWMNSDASIRAATSERAAELNQVYKDIIATTKYNNFDIVYYDIPIQDALNLAVADGYQARDIIEPVDGFHPSQLANFYFSEIIWGKIQQDRPEWIPLKNPNNKRIDQLFGNLATTLERS